MYRLAIVLLGALLASCGVGLGSSSTAQRPSVSRASPGATPFVTYRLAGGGVYTLAFGHGARPQDVSDALDRLSPGGGDEWLNVSPNGRWLLMSSERFGCHGWACLARMSSTLRRAAKLVTPSGPLHPAGFGAISSDGRLVVFPDGGGPHTADLWVSRLRGTRWSSPMLITAGSTFPRNEQPAISADGRRVVFDCDPQYAGGPGSTICSVSTSGGPVNVVVAPMSGPGGTARNEVHHADFAPDGEVVFEADWRGEQVWRIRPGAGHAVVVSRVPNDNSPCVLPDGRIASLYLDRPGNSASVHELRLSDSIGAHGHEILENSDVLDVGIGCG